MKATTDQGLALAACSPLAIYTDCGSINYQDVGDSAGVGMSGLPVTVTANIWWDGVNNDSPSPPENFPEYNQVDITWWVQDCYGNDVEYNWGQSVLTNPWGDDELFTLFPGSTVTANFTLPACPASAPDQYWNIMVVPNWDGAAPNSEYSSEDLQLDPVSVLPPGGYYGCVCGNSESGFSTPQVSRADPVDTATGAYTESATDVEVTGPGEPFTLSRTYSSANTATGPLGTGWSVPWSTGLSFDSSQNATLTQDDGSRYTFTYEGLNSSGDPRWSAATTGMFAALTGNGTDELLTTVDHHVLTFNSTGQLTSWVNGSGEGLTFSYTAGQVSSITDAAGRVVSLTYSGTLLTSVTLADGRSVNYGYTGNDLTSVTGVDGATVHYGYNSGGLLTTVTDALGHTTTGNVYNPSNQVASQHDAMGDTTRFYYVTLPNGFEESDTVMPGGGVWSDVYSAGVLVAEFDPFGNERDYSYYTDLLLSGETDWLGNATTYGYNSEGEITSETDPEGNSQYWDYESGNVSSYEDADFNTTDYTWTNNELTGIKDAAGDNATLTYNPGGQLASLEDFDGNTTQYQYDTNGDLTAVISPLGAKTTWQYNTAGQVTATTDPRGNVSGASAAAYTTQYSVDAAGRVTKVTDPLGNATLISYNAVGNVTQVTDPADDTTRRGYDKDERLTQVIDAKSVTSLSIGYDPDGQINTATDADGDTTTYTYDAADRPWTQVDPLGNVSGATASNYTWTYGYDHDGNWLTTTSPTGTTTGVARDDDENVTTAADGAGDTSTYTYNGDGDIESATDGLGFATNYAYNANNQLTQIRTPAGYTDYGLDPDGLTTSLTTPAKGETTYGYNQDGELTTVVDPRGNVSGATASDYTWTYAYDKAGNRTSVTDPLNDVYQSQYNADDQLTAATDPMSRTTSYSYEPTGALKTVTDPDTGVMQYAYDALGETTSVTDADGNTTDYGYDNAGNLTSVTDPLGAETTYGYDADGNQTTAVDARNQTTTTTYNSLDLPTAVSSTDGTTPLGYTYDAANRTSTVTDATGNRTYSYDADSNITSITGTSPEAGFSYSGYNSYGQPQSITYPDGATAAYAYTADGEVNSAKLSEPSTTGEATTYSYDAADNLTKSYLANGETEGYTYDDAGRLTALADDTSGGTAISSWTESLDKDGEPTQIATVHAGSSGVAGYGYDADGRVNAECAAACATGVSQIDYTYDKTGNTTSRTSASGTTNYTYNADNELATAATGVIRQVYNYDADGNYIGNGSSTNQTTYDAADQPTSAVLGSTTYDFTDDAQGNLVTTADASGTVRTTTWDENATLAQLATQTGADGATASASADYLYNPLGQTQSATTSSSAYYNLTDWQGGTSDVTNSSGSLQYSAQALLGPGDYDLYGTSTTKTASGATLNPDSDPFGFQGQYQDNLTNTYDLRARSYNPAIGQFEQTDPLSGGAGTPGSSTYSYANDQTTTETDPSGLSPEAIDTAPWTDPSTAADAPATSSGYLNSLRNQLASLFNDVIPLQTFQNAISRTLTDYYNGCAPRLAGDLALDLFTGAALIGGTTGVDDLLDLGLSAFEAWGGDAVDNTGEQAAVDALTDEGIEPPSGTSSPNSGTMDGGGARFIAGPDGVITDYSASRFVGAPDGTLADLANPNPVYSDFSDRVAFADVSSAPDTAFFWSGVPEELASDIAQSMDGTTLEALTRARGIEIPNFDPDVPEIAEAWTMISARYAAAASGLVRVVLPDVVRPTSVWNLIERPALLENPEVTNIVRVDPDSGEQSILY